MFRSIVSTIKRDKDYPARQFTLDVYSRVLNGTIYDHITQGFHEEQNDAGEYVPIRKRRPSVRYNLCRLVVEDSISLLFSEGHFPTPQSQDEPTREAAALLIKATKINEVMLEAATIGSAGSAAIQMLVLRQADKTTYKVFFKPYATGFLTPTFAPEDPERLIKVREQYKVKGVVLKAQGYDVPETDFGADFWFAREWDDQAESWMIPWKVADENATPDQIDAERSVTHDLGFVPWVWIKNLPGKLKLLVATGGGFSDIDGACTFEAAIDTMIEIEYQLSQAGRGLKYSMDPQLVLKEPPETGGKIVKSPGTALVVSDKGDAKMLEIGGEAFTVVLDYVRALREYGLENVHGNRAEATKLAAAQSGRAMELMNQALIWLADKLRVAYGEGALLNLLRMALQAHEKFPLTLGDGALPKGLKAQPLALIWPQWHAPTAHDLQEQATTVSTLTDGGLMSRETGIKTIASNYDIEDVQAEVIAIEADIAKASAVIVAQGGQPKPQESAPV